MIDEYELTVGYIVKDGMESKHCIYHSIDGCLKKIAESANGCEIEFISILPFKSGDSYATI